MNTPIDHYDAERIAEDKARDAREDAKEYTRDCVRQLQGELAELRDEVLSLSRVLNARTEHLV